MTINLSEILSRENYTIHKEVSADFDIFSNRTGTFSVKEKLAFTLQLTHRKKGECELKGNTKFVITASCDRCLKDVDVQIDVEFDKVCYLKGKNENDFESDEMNYIDGYNLDVDKLLYNEILIGWPMKILCSEDCKGICSVCGQNLNEGTCHCEETSLDPRMSVIRDVFKNFKEV